MHMTDRMATPYNIPEYFDFYEGVFKVQGIEYKGTLYKLCESLSNEEKTDLRSMYDNISFFQTRAEYAPEIVHSAIFISNKPIVR